jgi:protein-S-isoprenylcysteine O-methyltransferase Ste14
MAKQQRAKTGGGKGRAAQPQMSLTSRLVLGILVALAVAMAAVFVPAGSWRFWQGWAFLAVLFMPNAFTFFYFLKHDPEFLERRLRTKEQAEEQKSLLKWGKPLYVIAFLLPGFDYRFGWSRSFHGGVPLWLTVLSLAMVFASIVLVFRVLKVNRYASRTVQVEAGQTVVSTGPYSVVRHPYYAATVLLWLFTPLALGSYVAWPAFFLLIPFYVIRLINEEKILRQELPGYSDYCLRTRCRLIPFAW